jgi:hypothetical protein
LRGLGGHNAASGARELRETDWRLWTVIAQQVRALKPSRDARVLRRG